MKRFIPLLFPFLLGSCEEQEPQPERVRILCASDVGWAGHFQAPADFERTATALRMRIEAGKVDRDVRVDFRACISLGTLTSCLHHLAAEGCMSPDGYLGFHIEGQFGQEDFLWSVPLAEICCGEREEVEPVCDEWGEAAISFHYHYGRCVEYELVWFGDAWTSGTRTLQHEEVDAFIAKRRTLAASALVLIVVNPLERASSLLPVLEACQRSGTRIQFSVIDEYLQEPPLSRKKGRVRHPAFMPPRVISSRSSIR